MANTKKILAFLVLAAITLQVMAQDTRNPDLTFYMDFSPLDGSPSNSDIGGQSEYYHTDPNLYGLTNFLDIDIDLPTLPESAWILERKNNGTLAPVMEITNILGDSSYGYIWQQFTLTKEQIRSLAKGDWYVEVDFGGSNYISNLAPQYQFANGPTAVIDFLTPIYQQSYNHDLTVFIANNNRNAKVVIDASQSFDPLYFPKKYSWCVFDGYYGGAHTVLSTNNGAVATYAFSPGVYSLRLQVDDAFTDGWPLFFNVEVITPSQAVDSIIQEIEYLQLPENQTQTLVGILSRASALFDRGNLVQGCAELRYFIKEAKSLHFLGTVDDFTSQSARRIIAVLGFPIESEIIMFED